MVRKLIARIRSGRSSAARINTAASVFRPEALLREARRQKQLPLVAVLEICVLDPDGGARAFRAPALWEGSNEVSWHLLSCADFSPLYTGIRRASVVPVVN
jgi:hypothetical protein